ncbi:nucleotidyltransferase family protein [Aestuariimicrobium ganziense]|uniref:nucleotidyltransferase family protein n=1 Tax=Aestuariimicrobium ganziense TaxID=2773677 RepID=UPI001944D9F6|nr:nucleotidyltransferase family protein [Aestuariimicrobium ganziense]
MSAADVPMPTRVRLIHGVLQRLAEQAGADVLHIKGPAVAPEIMGTSTVRDPITHEMVEVVNDRDSSDADILIRPEHVDRLLVVMHRAGWDFKTSFAGSSAFGHAMNVHHPTMGNADLHRHFPGLDRKAFETLWADRGEVELGHVSCPVPSVTGQRLLLLVHAARSGPDHPDRDRAWGRASEYERTQVSALAERLHAEVGLAAALGNLEQYRTHREYLLWKSFGERHPSRLGEWRARWRAADGPVEKARVVAMLATMDAGLLEAELGRPPTSRDRVKRALRRWTTLGHEVRALLRRRRSR